MQISIYSPTCHLLGRADLGYPELGLLVEFDGWTKYEHFRRAGESIEDVIRREKRREDAMRELGWVIIRITWADLEDLPALRRRIEQGLARGRRVVALEGRLGSWASQAPVRVG